MSVYEDILSAQQGEKSRIIKPRLDLLSEVNLVVKNLFKDDDCGLALTSRVNSYEQGFLAYHEVYEYNSGLFENDDYLSIYLSKNGLAVEFDGIGQGEQNEAFPRYISDTDLWNKLEPVIQSWRDPITLGKVILDRGLKMAVH